MAILGEEIEIYVANQINVRQITHGSGVSYSGSSVNRTDKQINVLNSNTSWIKLASGVFINQVNRLTNIGLLSDGLMGTGLAENYILFSGISKINTQTVEEKSYTQLKQNEGFSPRNINGSYTYGSSGYSPMPGIISADIKTLNRGSLKKATVKLIANNKQQFDIIDLLYMRLGYTVLLEWGNSIYTTNGFDKKIVRNTLVEDQFFTMNNQFTFLAKIEEYRDNFQGNYDALLGKISNFNWSFNSDGSYSIELTIISLGDVIESLKSNLAVNNEVENYLTELKPTPPPSQPEAVEGENTEEVIPPETTSIDEENKSSNSIEAILAIIKHSAPYSYYSYVLSQIDPNAVSISSESEAGIDYTIGDLINIPQEENLVAEQKSYTFNIYYNTVYKSRYELNIDYKNNWETMPREQTTQIIGAGDDLEKIFKAWFEGRKTVLKTNGIIIEATIRGEYSEGTTVKTTITKNPLKGQFKNLDAVIINSKTPQYYLRFGALLNYIKNNIIIKVGDNIPIFKIDLDNDKQKMYTLRNQISLDPRVCIVRNEYYNIKGKSIYVYSGLEPFIDATQKFANPLNIYLNFNFILECLSADDKGNISVYDLISNICVGINKALGGVNNLEPVIDESTNILSLVDTTPIQKVYPSPKYILQLYGYNNLKNYHISNFVRKIDLKTAITPEFATMITIGATTQGYVKGVEATAFSKWNQGLKDRFKPKVLSPTGTSEGVEDEEIQESVKKYYEMHTEGNLFGYTDISSIFSPFDHSDNIIEKNISLLTEYYKWYIADKNKNSNTSEGTVGFIPFKLNLKMDGISGIKIYNILHVNTEFLPKVYSNTVDLIVTGISHTLSGNDWETSIETTTIPKPGAQSKINIGASIGQGKRPPTQLTNLSGFGSEDGATNSNAIIAGTPSGDYIKLKDLSKTSQSSVNLSDRITLVREWTNDQRTSGTLWYGGKVLGFTVEDAVRTKKIQNKTAIPKGTFNLVLDITAKESLKRCYVKFPGESGKFANPGVFPRVGTSTGAVSLEAYNLKFAGIRIHDGTSETSSAGCIIYSSKREANGKVKSDLAHNKALTKLIFNDKIKLITVINEWDNQKNHFT